MCGWVIAYFLFSKGSHPPLWIFIFHNFCEKFKFAPISSSSCKIWRRSDYPRPTYCVFSIFKMAAICHLGFHIFTFFVKNSNLHLDLHCLAKFGENRMMRAGVITYFLFSKWWPSTILDFIFPQFCENKSNLRLYLPRRAKFGEDQTIHGRVIVYFRFSKCRPSAILDLVWRHSAPPLTCVWWS